MADVYHLAFCSEVSSERKKISIVGHVDGTFDRGIYISDSTGKIKVLNVPKTVTGLIEVWGETNPTMEIESRGYTAFKDQNFDFSTHSQVVELMRKFQDLN